MKVYAQFLTININGKLSETLGSDGVFILDGRNNINTWKVDAMVRMNQLSNVQPNYIGYRIYKGNRFSDNNTMIYEWIKFGSKYIR